MDAAPSKNKNVFIVENYPRSIDRLPQNLPEVFHRARDIMFSDKTAHNVKLSRVITRYLQFIEQLYQIVQENIDLHKIDAQRLERIKHKHQKIINEHGAEIENIAYITREERFPYLYENTDFTHEGINSLIKEGEAKTKQLLKTMNL